MPSDDEKNLPVKQSSKNLDASQGTKEIEQPVVPDSSSQVEITTANGKHVVAKGAGTIDMSSSEFGTWKMSFIYSDHVEGDKFEKVTGSTIINRSLVNDSLNRVERVYGREASQAVKQIADHIDRSGDSSACWLFDRFNQELIKEELDRPALRKVWEDIQKILPSIATLSESSGKLKSLID